MPRLRTETPPLNPRTKAATLIAAAAAGAALAGLGGLLSRWCADAPLGWAIALSAAAVGAAAGSRGPLPEEESARGWLLGGALAALGAPALLRFLGLALADPARLQAPLGGASAALFELGQAALLAAVAAGAWTRATRGGGKLAAAAALAGAAAGAGAFKRAEPSVVLAIAALAAVGAAEYGERPWSRRETAPLRARVFGAAAVAALLLASLAPGLLRDVWMARLHGAYPGGRYLTFADDGSHVWAAYLFSTGDAVALRDGVVEMPDPQAIRLAICSLLGQFDESVKRSLLIVRAPQPQAPALATLAGASVRIDALTAAQTVAFNALAGGNWHAGLSAEAARGAPNAALLVLPPASASARGYAGRAALGRLRARLGSGAALAVLIPDGSPSGTPDAVTAAAAAAFGNARTADLPHGVLVLASVSPIVVDSQLLFGRLPDSARAAYPGGDHELNSGLRWRAETPAK